MRIEFGTKTLKFLSKSEKSDSTRIFKRIEELGLSSIVHLFCYYQETSEDKFELKTAANAVITTERYHQTFSVETFSLPNDI